LTDLLAYMDPVNVVDLMNAEAPFPNGGVTKQLVLRQYIYGIYSDILGLSIPLGPAIIRVNEAGIFPPGTEPAPPTS
jgi:hypothetical protein